jgi:hypothetical protein
MYPTLIKSSRLLDSGVKRIFIGAYGFEERSLGWVRSQQGKSRICERGIIFRYIHPKGKNQISALRSALRRLGVNTPSEVKYDLRAPYDLEKLVEENIEKYTTDVEEAVIDISAMTKFLILLTLCKLSKFGGTLRLVYTEAESYGPTHKEYVISKSKKEMLARFPSRGVEGILRARCLSSIRMQGQPVTLIAFTSFNEQLVRHMLGQIVPHRLVFINGRPPRGEYGWRELAAQEIHGKLIEEHAYDNPVDARGRLRRATSTLDYGETVSLMDELYRDYGVYERIICGATGSKMQTVGLFFSKVVHPDIHIEYPTPDSYFEESLSTGVRKVYEVSFPGFSEFLKHLRCS